jgi:iron complex transport system substrate-binding protein
MAAVREDQVVLVNDDIASRWGPRTVEFVETVVEGLEGVGGR